MSHGFRLLMIGAMYENGGNTTHRLLDGHPELFVYPFESQVGSHLVHDHLSSMFPLKYRWPSFALHATSTEDYRAIIDEEAKVRSRTPHVSKFRHVSFEMNDDERCDIYNSIIARIGRSRPNNVAAFFEATFKAWKDHRRSGREQMYVGYSPVIVVDADKILTDFPDAHFLHVVRNPWSAYADTKKRPVPLSCAHYMTGWALNQYHALYFKERFPDRLHILRLEDVLVDPEEVLGELSRQIGITPDASLGYPSWNGQKLGEVYPWGTIRRATADANRATAHELSATEIDDIRSRAGVYIKHFGYESFL